jgi:hypothetical protein
MTLEKQVVIYYAINYSLRSKYQELETLQAIAVIIDDELYQAV